jgi:hypothetical protein
LIRHSDLVARHSDASSPYRAWVGRVDCLAQALRDLAPTAEQMRLPPAESFAWHGNLFQKLLPQLAHEPFLIVAVTGGTNTGKSVLFNHLAGSRLSRTHPNATQTKHPVCSVPQGFLARHDLASVFPDFEVRQWANENDPLTEGADNWLFVQTDPAGTQPARLLLFDTPDIDGTLRDNWRRAELVRHAADVLVCVLTQQKYNDAAVREFFQAAAAVDKTVIVIFNMVHWPRQRELVDGWLKKFCHETGIEPVHVYAVPWDHDAAEENRLPFYPLSSGATNPRDDLAELHFDEIKIRSFRGSLRGVLDVGEGVPAYLALIERRAGEYREARDLLFNRLRLEIKDLPQLPRRLVWDEIWHWLEHRRTRFDRAVNGVYSAIGSVFSRWLGKDAQSELAHFQDEEWDKLRLAMSTFLDLVDTLRRGGNEILRDVLDRTPAALDRRGLFDELKRRHAAMPLLTDGYRAYVRAQLDLFEKENPNLVKFITRSLVTTAVVRPLVTVGLFWGGAHAVDLAAGHVVNMVGDIVVGAATAVTGEGLIARFTYPLQQLLSKLFSRFYVERADILANSLHELVLGQAVDEVKRLADVPQSEAFVAARQAVEELRVMS